MSDYIAEPNEDKAFIEGAKIYQGSSLAPFSQGVRLLWLNLSERADHPDFMCCCLLWLLVEMHKEFDAAMKETKDLESSWFLAKSRLCNRVSDKEISRGRVIEFMEKGKSKKDLSDAVSLALLILKEAEDSEPEPSGEEGLAMGEHPPQASPLRSCKSAKRQAGKKKQ